VLASIFCAACGGTSVDSDGGDLSDGGNGGNSEQATELGSCDPLDDSCAAGTYCQVQDGRTSCLPEGTTERDGVCEVTGSCQRGSICAFASELYGKSCQQPCPLEAEPWDACDLARHTCFVAVDDDGNELPFGVCRY
jgi:hypothetical protein